MSSRWEFIEQEISRARDNEPDAWKAEYYSHAAGFLAAREFAEGGQITAHCRKQGLGEPHHHNVWGAMISSLQKLGWVVKVGSVRPSTKHTHIGSVARWQSQLFVKSDIK